MTVQAVRTTLGRTGLLIVVLVLLFNMFLRPVSASNDLTILSLWILIFTSCATLSFFAMGFEQKSAPLLSAAGIVSWVMMILVAAAEGNESNRVIPEAEQCLAFAYAFGTPLILLADLVLASLQPRRQKRDS